MNKKIYTLFCKPKIYFPTLLLQVNVRWFYYNEQSTRFSNAESKHFSLWQVFFIVFTVVGSRYFSYFICFLKNTYDRFMPLRKYLIKNIYVLNIFLHSIYLTFTKNNFVQKEQLKHFHELSHLMAFSKRLLLSYE